MWEKEWLDERDWKSLENWVVVKFRELTISAMGAGSGVEGKRVEERERERRGFI